MTISSDDAPRPDDDQSTAGDKSDSATGSDSPADESPSNDAAAERPVEGAGEATTGWWSRIIGFLRGSEDEPAERADDAATHGEADDDQAEDDEELPEWEPLTPELVEEEAERGDFMLRWAVVLLAILLACHGLIDTLTLVRIKTGQATIDGGGPPMHDSFSVTAEGRQWVNLPWLFDTILAGCYALPGHDIWLSVLVAVVVALTFWLVVHISRSRAPTWGTSVIAAVALLACFPQFTALPILVTPLGLALVLWLLERWKASGRQLDLWLVIPVVIVWSNLDQRAFLGPLLLLLYAAGSLLKSRGTDELPIAGHRRLLGSVAGLSVLALVINPNHYHALLSPWVLYVTELPLQRVYHPIMPGVAASIDRFAYYPPLSLLTWNGTHGNWSWLNYHVVAGLAVMVTAVVMLVLNRRRLHPGDAAIVIGFVLVGMLSMQDLAATAVVLVVVAGLNAQAWYKASFRQEYTVEMRELVFSRGGRALTVLAFFGLAFLAISGRLTAPDGRKLGLGFDPDLEAVIEGMKTELNERLFATSDTVVDELDRGTLGDGVRKAFSANDRALSKAATLEVRDRGSEWAIRDGETAYLLKRAGLQVTAYLEGLPPDHQAFNFVPSQGDVMIWIGHRPFIDGRLALFDGSDRDNTLSDGNLHDNDVVDMHLKTRAALRLKQLVTIDGEVIWGQVTAFDKDSIELTPPAGKSPPRTIARNQIKRQSVDMAEFAIGRPDIWRRTFDCYGITHVLPRLSGPAPDYPTFYQLISQQRDWQLARLGSTTAVFYRKQDTSTAINEFRETHELDFVVEAFQTVTDKLEPRPLLAQPETFYQSYLAHRKRRLPPAVARAAHWDHMLRRFRNISVHIEAMQRVQVDLMTDDLSDDPEDAFTVRLLGETTAMAYLAIRAANEGLLDDPNNARAFQVLGDSYAFLGVLETLFRGPAPPTSPNARRRHVQALHAYNQALVIEPDSVEVLWARYQQYRQFGQFDLQLESLRRFEALTANADADERLREIRNTEIVLPLQALTGQVKAVNEQLARELKPDDEPIKRLQDTASLVQRGFTLAALKALTDHPLAAGTPDGQLLRLQLMIEAGIYHDEATATNLDDLRRAVAEQQQPPRGFRTTLALARLAYADYEQANHWWTTDLAQLEQRHLMQALGAMPLVLPPRAWPFQQTATTTSLLVELPGQRSEILWNVAMSHLEAGRINQAADHLERLLEVDPDSHLRPLAQFYRAHITDKVLTLSDTLGPSKMIPVEPDMFVSEPAEEGDSRE